MLAAIAIIAGLVSCSHFPIAVADSGEAIIHFDPDEGLLEPIGPWFRYESWLDKAPTKGPVPIPSTVQAKAPLFGEREDRSTARTFKISIAIDGPAVARPWMMILPMEGPGIRAVVNGVVHPVKNRILSFESAQPLLDILVQVPPGVEGIDSIRLAPDLIMFGDASSVGGFLVLAGGLSLLFAGSFAFGGIFILFLFNLWTKNREFLAFAIVLGVEALRYLINARAILPTFPLAFNPDLIQALAFLAHFAVITWFFTRIVQERASLPSKLVIIPFLSAAALEILLP
ncbi:MAG TPA: hypothetical protein VMV44_00780, partial [Rectinemataceae bacterium]|nr:hypothetical protein [Rectinemataceae bacterium]